MNVNFTVLKTLCNLTNLRHVDIKQLLFGFCLQIYIGIIDMWHMYFLRHWRIRHHIKSIFRALIYNILCIYYSAQTFWQFLTITIIVTVIAVGPTVTPLPTANGCGKPQQLGAAARRDRRPVRRPMTRCA